MKRYKDIRIVSAFFLAIGATLFLYSCSGSSSDGTTPAPTGMTSGGELSGTAVKGPVNNATITAYAIDNGTMGAQIVTGTTDTQGKFTLSMGNYSGPVMVQMSGGTYTDEATNTTMTMHSGDVMTCVIPSMTSGATMTGIQVTPLTSMAQSRAHSMTGGMTEANITAANDAIGTFYMVNDILHTTPMNPLVSGSGAGADTNMRNYGMTIAAMSQYASSLGMPSSSGIITAMMDDASDGTMDGMRGGTAISLSGMGGMMGGSMMSSTAGTSGMAAAMTAFISNGMVNRSGLTVADMQTLMNQLSTSTGQFSNAGGTSTNGMVSGTVVMGPVSSGAVAAFAVNSGVKGAQVASGQTDTHGNFTMQIGAYNGPLMLVASGCTYTDPAMGTMMTMSSGDMMTSVIPSLTSGATMTGVQVTPLTSMAQMRAQNMTGSMTAENITAANTAVGNYFMVNDILMTQPMDTTHNGSGASQDMRNYGMTIAAMSQEASTLGMAHSSGMVTAMMNDASDGVMNGMMGGSVISMTGMGGGMMTGTMQSSAGTTGLATAMTTFINNTAVNRSGLTTADMTQLINKLNGSSGTIQ